ncbi:MAG TPA: response regulator [Acidimicrobiales bacterium]
MTGGAAVRVVVVDDEPDICHLLGVQFRYLDGFEFVGSASDGSEIIELVDSARADAVVMDLLMPGVNGFDAISALREHKPDIGIVAYSGVAGDFVRQEMQRRGVELVLKSGDVRPLAEALRRSVARTPQRSPD